MAKDPQRIDYFHLSGASLAPSSIIEPGNWGRVIRAYGWQHNQALREMALENARLSGFQHRPSRMDAAFIFVTLDEAQRFRQSVNGFQQHLLYRVTLCNPSSASHLTDSRLCAPQGTLRHDWATIYWLDVDAQAAAIPGIDWAVAVGGVQLREMLTLSQLRIEERLN
jgi:hypothetical protein